MLNTIEDKDKVNPDFIELYENDYFTIYEEDQEGYPFIHTLIYNWNKTGVCSWIDVINDICKVLQDEGHEVVATTPLKDNTAIVKITERAGFHEVDEVFQNGETYSVMVRDL